MRRGGRKDVDLVLGRADRSARVEREGLRQRRIWSRRIGAAKGEQPGEDCAIGIAGLVENRVKTHGPPVTDAAPVDPEPRRLRVARACLVVDLQFGAAPEQTLMRLQPQLAGRIIASMAGGAAIGEHVGGPFCKRRGLDAGGLDQRRQSRLRHRRRRDRRALDWEQDREGGHHHPKA